MSHSIRGQGSRKIAKDFARDPAMHGHSDTASFIIFFPFPSPSPSFHSHDSLSFHFYPLSSAFLFLLRPRNEILYERATEHVAAIEVACELFDVDLPIDFHLRRFNSTSVFIPLPSPITFSFPLSNRFIPCSRSTPDSPCSTTQLLRNSAIVRANTETNNAAISFVNIARTR